MTEPPIRVLVVEDDTDDFLILKVMLSGVQGRAYELDRASTYEEAMEKIGRNGHHVCLLDYRLQGKDGIDFLKEARQKGRTTPIIFLTGLGDYDVDLEAMRMGAADFLHKDRIDKVQLERSIRYALERSRSEEKLRHSEEFFRAILENAQDGVALVGGDGRIHYASPSFKSILGYEDKEKTGSDFIELVHPEDAPRMRTFLRGLLASPEKVLVEEFQVLRRDGQWRVLETSGKGHAFGKEEAPAVVINFRDVTERKNAERTTSRLATIVESSNDAVYSVNMEGVILSWNPGAERIYGFKPEEIGGRDLSMVVPQEARPEFDELFSVVKGGNPVSRVVSGHKNKRGTPMILSLTISPIKNNRGQVIWASIIARDITERERTRVVRDMLQSERDELLVRLQTQMERMPIACLLADENFHFTYWNPAAEQVFGYRFQEVEGKHPKDVIIAPMDWPAVDKVFQRIALGDMTAQGVPMENLRKDGRAIHCEWYNTPLRDASGKFTGIMSMALDVTERRRAEEELARSEGRFRQIFQESPLGMALVGFDSKIMVSNPRLCEILGYGPGELTGKSFAEITHKEDVDLDLGQFKKLMDGEVPRYEMEKRYVRRDGGVIWGRLMATLVRDISGKPLYGLGMVTDITESRKAEETRRRLGSILEQTHDGVIVSDLDGTIVDWNRGAEEIYGYKASEIVGKKSSVLEGPGRAGEIDAFREELLKGKPALNYETVRKRKNGELVHIDSTFSPLRDERGVITGFSAIVRDITGRKRAESVQSQLAAILQQTPDAVIGFDLDNRIFSWNRGAEDLFGYGFDEIVGQSADLLAPPEKEHENREMRDIALAGESISNFETVRLKKDGGAVDVSITLSPIKDGNGKIVGISAITRDITERKRAEESLKKHEEQMRLAQKMDAIGRLAGGVAHDFNNLLSVIGGNAEFLLGELEGKDPKREELEEIQKAVRRGAELSKQLLVFSQKQVVQPQPVNLNELSSEMSKMLKRLIDATVELTILGDKDLPAILADPGQMQQVILNLVLNARDAMPKGGNVIVETKSVPEAAMEQEGRPSLPMGSYVRLSVTDTGTGMSPEIQKHVFEPFFTTKAGKGTGLGLASVYGIVTKWSGHIFLHSTVGMGTTFTFYFPALAKAEAAGQKAKQMDLIPQGSETILVAEDEEPVRKILVRTLERYGYKVLDAVNGVDAVKKAWDYQDVIHLLLTDTIMPKMNGKELSEELKKSRPKTKVVFISGYPKEVLSQQGILESGIHLIQKPFELEDLVRQVRRILDEK